MSFNLPEVVDNPSGWGPRGALDGFEGTHFATFDKSQRLGRVADFLTGSSRSGGVSKDVGFLEAAYVDAGEMSGDGFVRVGGVKSRLVGGRPHHRHVRAAGRRRGRGRFRGRQNYFRDRGFRRYGNREVELTLDFSLDVKHDWVVKLEFSTTDLAKERLEEVPKGVTVFECGKVGMYVEAMDGIVPRKGLPLPDTSPIPRFSSNITTSDDPVLSQFMSSNEDITVFATDKIVSLLMCSPRSVYPWDIIIRKKDGKLFLDKRSDNTLVDNVSVSENARIAPDNRDVKSINSHVALVEEATRINKKFLAKCVSGDEFEEFGDEVPEEFSDDSVGYRYRKFDFGDGIVLLVRTQVDAQYHSSKDDTTEYCMIRAANEYDPKTTKWNAQLETQKLSLFVTEVMNNAMKYGRWASECVLSGVEMMKIGYVRRIHDTHRRRHRILAVDTMKPTDVIKLQGTLDPTVTFAALLSILQKLMKLEDGRYLLLKVPNKRSLTLYELPEDVVFDNRLVREEEIDDEDDDAEVDPLV